MEWIRGPIIGRGATATVSLATDILTGDLFAVKSAELSCSEVLQKEKQILSQLSSPYIVKYLGFDITRGSSDIESNYNLFMEYVPGVALSEEIGGGLDESMIRSCAHQILQGLDYLHLNGIVHCDIKGENILVSKCKDGSFIKIADLGCAKIVQNGCPATSAFSGTPVFMSPEVARGEEQGFPADIWALGCTIIQMATGYNPWPEMKDPVSALYRIGFSGDVPEFPKGLSEKAKDLLSKCLVRDAKERWTAEQLLEHPFFDDGSVLVKEFCIKDSPTCVLDQDFWNAWEVQETCPSSVSDHPNSTNSPAQRISLLIGGASDFSNWSGDENWITVRCHSAEDISPAVNDNESLMDDCVPTEEFLDEEEEMHESLLALDVNLLLNFNHSAQSINPIISSGISDREVVLYDDFCDDNVVISNLSSEMENNETIFFNLIHFSYTIYNIIYLLIKD